MTKIKQSRTVWDQIVKMPFSNKIRGATFTDAVCCVVKRHSDTNPNHVVSQLHMGFYYRVFQSRTRLCLPDRSYKAHSMEQYWSKLLPCTPESPELAGLSVISHRTLSLITPLQGGWTLGCQPVSVTETLVLSLHMTTFKCNVTNFCAGINTKKMVCVFILVVKECRQAWRCFPLGCVPASPFLFPQDSI